MSARREAVLQSTGARQGVFRVDARIPDSSLCLRCGAAVAEVAFEVAMGRAASAPPGDIRATGRSVLSLVSERVEKASPVERLRFRFDLTRMETAVACGLLNGFSYREIAEEFGIGYETVHSHVKAIHRKAEVQTTGQFVALFLSGR
jgi:DNA-binding CsgD family transcriptional regulator